MSAGCGDDGAGPYRVRRVPGDGNCFFRAVALGLGMGSQSARGHVLVRDAVVQHVAAEWGRFRPALRTPATPATPARYRRHMGRDGVPATGIEVLAAAQALGTDIAVHIVHLGSQVYRFQSGPGRCHRVLHLRFSGPPQDGHFDLLELAGCQEGPACVARVVSVRSNNFFLLRGGGPSTEAPSEKKASKRKKNRAQGRRGDEQYVKDLLRCPLPELVPRASDLADGELAQLCFHLLQSVKQMIVANNLKKFQELWTIVESLAVTVGDGVDRFCNWFQDDRSPFCNTNLLIFVCKYNRWDILQYLLAHSSHPLHNGLFRSWNVESLDEDNHCCMYYIVKSGKVEMCKLLLSKAFVSLSKRRVNLLLERLYDELLLKRICLSDEMVVFIEQTLLDSHFSWSTAGNTCPSPVERIDFTLEAISSVSSNECEGTISDMLLDCYIRFIVKNLFILKRFYSDYELPWEEMQFFLVTFLERGSELHHFVLTNFKIISKLKAFGRSLSSLKELLTKCGSRDSSMLCDEKIEKKVQKYQCLEFQEITEDFEVIRDICSLEKIWKHLLLAGDADCTDRLGQLVIQGALQAINVHFKLTSLVTKLSHPVVKLLFFLSPADIRYLYSDLSDVLSSASSLCESNYLAAVEFFGKVQQDLRKFCYGVNYALYKRRLHLLQAVAEMVLKTQHIDDVKEVMNAMRRATPTSGRYFRGSAKETNELLKIEELLGELLSVVPENAETALNVVNELKKYYAKERRKLTSIVTQYDLALSQLLSGFEKVLEELCPLDTISVLFEHATNALKTINSYSVSLKHEWLLERIRMLTDELEADSSTESSTKFRNILSELSGLCDLETEEGQTMDYFLNTASSESDLLSRPCRPILGKDFLLKVLPLKKVLRGLGVSEMNQDVAGAVGVLKENESLRTALEVLVLDVLSDMNDKCLLVDNVQSLDRSSSILTGKELLRYLKHSEPMVPALITNPAVSVLLTAIKLGEDANILLKDAKVEVDEGDNVPSDMRTLQSQLQENLKMLSVQESMFQAAECGDFEGFQSSIKGGADVMGCNLNSWTAFHFAVKGGNLRVVQYLCGSKVGIGCQTLHGETALHFAAIYGRTQVAEYLIDQHGMNVNAVDGKGRTPLHLAALYGHTDVLQSLLKRRAESNSNDHSGLTPMHYAALAGHEDVFLCLMATPDAIYTLVGHSLLSTAAQKGHTSIVRRMVTDFSVDVNAKDDRRWTALHCAAGNGHKDVARVLVDRGANVNSKGTDGSTPLILAAMSGHEALVVLLLEAGAAVDTADREDECTPLLLAVLNGHLDVMKKLIEKKANVNAKNGVGRTSLIAASAQGHAEMVRVLLEHGAAVDVFDQENGMAALHYASRGGHSRAVELLVDAGARVDARCVQSKATALQLASACEDLALVALLIRSGALLDAEDSCGKTPLLAAAISGRERVAELLLESGASLAASDQHADTALHLAALHGHTQVVQLLLDRGIDVEATNANHDTALHLASSKRQLHVVKLLVSKGAKVDVRNGAGETPLYKAICTGSRDVAEVLIDAGADVSAKTSSGAPFLLAAIKKNFKDVVQLLLDKGVNVNAKNDSGCSALGLAVLEKLRDVVRILLSCSHTNRNVVSPDGLTLLHMAARCGSAGMVADLAELGFDVNSKIKKPGSAMHHSTPLHVAACMGFSDVIRALLSRGANIEARDAMGRAAIHLSCTHVDCTRALVAHSSSQVHALGPNNHKPLHFAVLSGNLEAVKFLISSGADIHALNINKYKPVHLAVLSGCLPVTKFFLENGNDVGDRGAGGCTLLHLAVSSGRIELVAYLLDRGADVNALNPLMFACTPLHIAASQGKLHVLELLLDRGAVYDTPDGLGRTPAMLATDVQVARSLSATCALFKAFKKLDVQTVRDLITDGAFVNARRSDGSTLLILAAWKGYVKAVNILLENRADPNLCAKNGTSPLHCAATFGHPKIVKALLAAGAALNCANYAMESLKSVKDSAVVRIIQFVAVSFKKVENNDLSVISDMERNADLAKALLNARNHEDKSLIDVAIISGFSRLEYLKRAFQNGYKTKMELGTKLESNGKYKEAEQVYEELLRERRQFFGANSTATLDLEENIATMMCLQGKVTEALSIFEKIYNLRLKRLGAQHVLTLHSKGQTAVVLHKLGRNQEALLILKEIYPQQRKLLSEGDRDTIRTVLNMAMVVRCMGDLGEALRLFRTAYEMSQNYTLSLTCLNNIGGVLSQLKRHKEAIATLEDAWHRRRQLLGARHQETASSQLELARASEDAGLEDQAMSLYEDLVKMGCGDKPETLSAKERMAAVLTRRGKLVPALRLLEEVVHSTLQTEADPHAFVARDCMEVIRSKLNQLGPDMYEQALRVEEVVLGAVRDRDVDLVGTWLRLGYDPNASGLLQLAVRSAHVPMVYLLLREGADPTLVSREGDTALHVAAELRLVAMTARLLDHARRRYTLRLCAFVNAVGRAGATALHIAARAGAKEIVKCLLTHGAAYDARDSAGSTLLEECADPSCQDVIKIVHEIFTAAQIGNRKIGEALEALIPLDMLAPVLYARNSEMQTLAKVAIDSQQKQTAVVILNMLRRLP